jgi:hypothetical protein
MSVVVTLLGVPLPTAASLTAPLTAPTTAPQPLLPPPLRSQPARLTSNTLQSCSHSIRLHFFDLAHGATTSRAVALAAC